MNELDFKNPVVGQNLILTALLCFLHLHYYCITYNDHPYSEMMQWTSFE